MRHARLEVERPLPRIAAGSVAERKPVGVVSSRSAHKLHQWNGTAIERLAMLIQIGGEPDIARLELSLAASGVAVQPFIRCKAGSEDRAGTMGIAPGEDAVAIVAVV